MSQPFHVVSEAIAEAPSLDLVGCDEEDPRKTPGEDPRARRAMTENEFYVIYAPGMLVGILMVWACF